MSRKFSAVVAAAGLSITGVLGLTSIDARAGHGRGGYEYDDDDACGRASCGWCGGSSFGYGGYCGYSPCGHAYVACGYSSCGFSGYSAGVSRYAHSSYGYQGVGSPSYGSSSYSHGHSAYREHMFSVLGYGLPAYRYMFPAYSDLSTPSGYAPYAARNIAPRYRNGGYGAASPTNASPGAYRTVGSTTGRDGIPEVRLAGD